LFALDDIIVVAGAAEDLGDDPTLSLGAEDRADDNFVCGRTELFFIIVEVPLAGALLLIDNAFDLKEEAGTLLLMEDAGAPPFTDEAGTLLLIDEAGILPFTDEAATLLFTEEAATLLLIDEAGTLLFTDEAGMLLFAEEATLFLIEEAGTLLLIEDAGTLLCPEDMSDTALFTADDRILLGAADFMESASVLKVLYSVMVGICGFIAFFREVNKNFILHFLLKKRCSFFFVAESTYSINTRKQKFELIKINDNAKKILLSG